MAQNRLLVNHEQDSIQLSWQTGQAAPRFAPAVPFEHPFDTQALAELRWYLEEYLRYPYGIEPERAANTEQKFQVWGQQLFDLVFSRTQEAQEFFQEATREGLEQCEIAIASDNPAVLNLPWELLYSPKHQFLAPSLAGIYRRVGNAHPTQQAEIGEMSQDKLNILLVIARPYGEQDVAFKTIARPMLEALKPIRQQVNLKVLRPPSFQEFERELNANKGFYHIVHFDGHGTVNANGQGELVFETLFGTEQKITAEKIAQKLADCRVPVFVLNACKSAQEGGETFSSVAAQLIFSGAKGVVAMAYSVYAEAAKHFIGGLYGELARGASLAEAVAAARRMVLNQPLRPSPKGNLPLQDWLVPVLYQQETYTPFSPAIKPKSEIPNPESKIEMVDLPEEGAYGFIGRDYDILRLERAFRKNHVGLLKGMGGVGKTELVCGFARWLDETQGRTGGIFLTSFEHGAGLSQVVNQIGRALGGDKFSQLMPEQQQTVVLEYLQTNPCLLIWDNFEPVAGFPTGNEPLLSDAERDNLKQFLKDLGGGQSWVLITSRREESWLEDCNYKRLALSGLSGQDVEEFAAKILQRVGVDRRELPPEYLDLLKLLGGHPFCLRVVLPHLKTQSPTELMEALRLGLDTFQGAEEEGIEKSLYVSLDYSFAKLSERARQHLPFLALFSERVIADGLHFFSNSPHNPYGQAYKTVLGENLQQVDWLSILNEAAEAGILEHLDKTLYKIHPALPWYLRQRLAERHPKAAIGELEKELLVFYTQLADDCNETLISNAEQANFWVLIEEPNLLQNLRLAEQQQDWGKAEAILQALGEVYQRLGRRQEFKFLRRGALNQIGKNLVEAKEKGREAFSFWVYLQINEANEAAQSAELKISSTVYQEIIDELTALNDPSVNNQIAGLNHNLGNMALERRQFGAAITYYQTARTIRENLGNLYTAADTYHQLGNVVYFQERVDEAIAYYQTALQIYKDAGDLYKAADSYHQLGLVAEKQQLFDKAITYYQTALQLYKDAGDLYKAADSYHNLGVVAQEQRQFEEAQAYYQESLKIWEDGGDFYKAADSYQNLGIVAEEQQSVEEAITYYQKALKIYEESEDFYKASYSCYKLGKISQEQENFASAIAYFQKAFVARSAANDWRKASLTLATWGETLEAQENWNEAIKIYIKALAIDIEHNEEWISLSIRNLGRILKVLGERQFEAVWAEVTGEECSEEWLSAFRKANEAEE
jgi:tetratricopeptide (TPR) repeat protein